MSKPVIGITMGDPAGIGPEIIVKSLSAGDIFEVCRPVVIGDMEVIKKAISICKLNTEINVIDKPAKGRFKTGALDLIDMKNVGSDLKIGEIQAAGGNAAYDYIKRSVEMALSQEIDAVATAPINKESLRAAGIELVGHTEIFAALTDTADPLTMFEVRNMRVFFLTRHVSLARACTLITEDRLTDYITRCTEALGQLGITEGTMAVAGLNPHSGEHGLFGNEEILQIEPAVMKARANGYNVAGPIGADSVFHLALQGRFNSVLSLYHDQGHIATKTLDFERTISLTLGLPFLRTSVDHGTAFDIAGTGKASAVGMTEAINLAAKYSVVYHV